MRSSLYKIATVVALLCQSHSLYADAAVVVPRADSTSELKIVKPVAGYTVSAPNPYYQGATADIPFEVHGNEDDTGYVRVELLSDDSKGLPIAKRINYTNGYAEAPITVLLDKLHNGKYNLAVTLFNDKDTKMDKVDRDITYEKISESASSVSTSTTASASGV